MSEMTPAAAESAPVSTADVASEVYDSFESSESDSSNESGAVDTPSTPVDSPQEAKAPGVIQPAPKPLTEAEKLLHAEGFQQERRDDGRENRIPYSKVKKIIENGINQGKGEFGQRYQALETQHRELSERVTRDIQPILERLDEGPEAFLAEAAKLDPRYKAFLEQRSAPAAPAQIPGLPPPDLPLPDGSRTYSIEGIEKSLIPYIVQQAKAEAKAEALAAMKPITEREARAQQQAKQAATEAELRQQTKSAITEAETWRHFGKMPEDGISFNPVQAAVLEELRKDSAEARAAGRRPRLSLEAAYLRVTQKMDIESESEQRKRFAQEVNAAAKSPSAPRTGGETPRTGRSASTAEIAARTLARLESGA